jgi:hypothetical protein
VGAVFPAARDCGSTEDNDCDGLPDDTVDGFCPVSPPLASNLALAAFVSAQSTFPGYAPERVNDGNTDTTLGEPYSWTNGHTYTADGQLPQWLQLDFARPQTVSRFELYTTVTLELSDYEIEAWSGSEWLPIVSVIGNTSTHVTNRLDEPVVTSSIRLMALRGPISQVVYARVNELEIY